MKGIMRSASILTLLLSSVTFARDAKALLKSINTLTLYKGRMTTHRRVKALPQLLCIGGSGQGKFEVDVMRCTNSGSSYDEHDVEWTCKAELPPEFKLGSTDVICEGYANSDDPYILKGSCAVEYRLVLTDLGEQKYAIPKVPRPGGDSSSGKYSWSKGEKLDRDTKSKSPGSDEPLSEKIFNVIFWCFFIGVGLWIAWMFISSLFTNGGGNTGPRRPRAAGRGGYGDDDDDPPPPYTDDYQPPQPRQPRQSSQSAKTSSPRTSRSSRSGESWRPGFFSGAGAGAAGGYAAGTYQERQRQARAREEERARAQERSWFGDTFNFNRNNNAGEGPSNPRPPPQPSSWSAPSSSSDTPSSSRYESIGFGSTRRR